MLCVPYPDLIRNLLDGHITVFEQLPRMLNPDLGQIADKCLSGFLVEECGEIARRETGYRTDVLKRDLPVIVLLYILFCRLDRPVPFCTGEI